MPVFSIVSKYFWLVCLLVTLVNVFIWKRQSGKFIAADPSLAEGYARLFRGAMIWMSIPWVVMGVGCTLGGVPSVWHYFRPQDGDPFVLAWFASLFVVWGALVFWIFIQNGAEALVRYPGLFNVPNMSVVHVKLFTLVSLAGGIAGVVMMCVMNVPIPEIP